MNRCRVKSKSRRFSARIGPSLAVAGVMLLLGGCGDGPGNPRPPQSPPRPVTEYGYVSTAHMVLPARPVPPKPGMM